MKISPMDPGLRWLWDHLPCLNLQAKSNQMRSTSLYTHCASIHKPFKSFRCWNLNLVWRLMALIRENRYTPNFRPYKSTVLHRTPVEESIHFMPKQTYCFSRTLRPACFSRSTSFSPRQFLRALSISFCLPDDSSLIIHPLVELLLGAGLGSHGWKAFIYWVR